MNMKNMAEKAFEKAMLGIDTVDFDGGFCVRVDEDEFCPTAHAIIYDGDLTAIAWEDGSVTRTHRREGDEYDALFGTLACIVRKLSNNRGHAVDDYEDWMRDVAGKIHSLHDLDVEIAQLEEELDVLRTLRLAEGKWLPQLGDHGKATASDFEIEIDKLIDEALSKDVDMTRQEIRNLIHSGEL